MNFLHPFGFIVLFAMGNPMQGGQADKVQWARVIGGKRPSEFEPEVQFNTTYSNHSFNSRLVHWTTRCILLAWPSFIGLPIAKVGVSLSFCTGLSIAKHHPILATEHTSEPFCCAASEYPLQPVVWICLHWIAHRIILNASLRLTLSEVFTMNPASALW